MSCTYDEACNHLEAAYAANPAQYGGTYLVKLPISGKVHSLELSIQDGIARPARDAS